MQAQERNVLVTGTATATESLFRSAVSTLTAKSLAIVGASERARWPSEIFRNLREFGYPGRIALVNPRQKSVFGQRCFPSLRDLPEPVDHALVIVPAPGVPDVLMAAEESGIGSATVYASMLGDGDAPESKTRGAWLEDFTAKSRLRVAGPNCMGAYSYRERLFGYPNADLCRLAPGPVACIFQSGGLIQFWMKAAADRGLRYSYCITSGNEPDLGLADYLNFVIDDPHTRQIVLFIEGIRRPQAFMHAAGRALAMGKPILAIKTGVTAKSRAASQSHTGAIAGDYAAYLAMCERYGIVNHRSLDDLVETALAFEGGRLPKGIAPKNPLDVGIPSTLEVAAKICETAARDRNIDMVAWASPMPRKGEAWGDAAALRQLLTKTDKPVVGFGRVIQQLSDDHLAEQQAAGLPFLQGIEPTIRALAGLWFHAAHRGRAPAPPPPAPPSDLSPTTLEATLARYGIALPKSRAVADAAEAVSAAERIGFPVALKIRSPDVLHKTEIGGVALGLQNREAVQAAAEALAASARAAQPSARIDGFLVQEMVSGIETIVGARDDPFYGPLLLVGSGGVLVELAADAALRLLPVAAGEVSTMVDSLKLAQRLSGFRGQPAADRAAFEAAAFALGRFFLDHRARIKDLEINPLMVRAPNQSPVHDPQSKVQKPAGVDPSVVAVDVRVLWREPGEGT